MVGAMFFTVGVGGYRQERAEGWNDAYSKGLELTSVWIHD